MTILNILLQEAQQGSSAFSSIFMIVALIAIFYFFMIRPQSKRQKEIREGLQSGDKVVTAGGIHGKIKEIKPDSNVVILEIADGVKIRIDKGSIYATAQDANDGQANGDGQKA